MQVSSINSSLLFKYSYTLLPVIASILLTPAATPPSDNILNNPTCEVLFKWVPPQSSIE